MVLRWAWLVDPFWMCTDFDSCFAVWVIGQELWSNCSKVDDVSMVIQGSDTSISGLDS